MLEYLIQTNYGSAITALFLLTATIIDNSFTQKVRRLFTGAGLCLLALILADCVNYWQSSFPAPGPLRYISAAAGYTLRPAVMYLIALMIRRRRATVQYLYGVPLMFDGVAALISCFNRCMFAYTADNIFVRGPLGYMPFIVSGFYMTLMIASIILEFRKNGYTEMIIIFSIAAMSCLATALECAFDYKFLLNSTIGVGLVFYYLYLHVQLYKRDTLTDLLNRRSFYLDAQKYQDKPMCIAALDMNGLKAINDGGGHSAGDSALISLTQCVQDALPRKARMYRTGGDEFMVISRGMTCAGLESTLARAEARLEALSLSVSYGTALYLPGMNFDDVCNLADSHMYERKLLAKRRA